MLWDPSVPSVLSVLSVLSVPFHPRNPHPLAPLPPPFRPSKAGPAENYMQNIASMPYVIYISQDFQHGCADWQSREVKALNVGISHITMRA